MVAYAIYSVLPWQPFAIGYCSNSIYTVSVKYNIIYSLIRMMCYTNDMYNSSGKVRAFQILLNQFPRFLKHILAIYKCMYIHTHT